MKWAAMIWGLSWALMAGMLEAATARVIQVEAPGATRQFVPRTEPVMRMLERGLLEVTRKPDPVTAWRSLVSTQDTIGIKVYSRPGATSGTRPTVVEAVVRGLVDAGVPAPQIVIWDQHLTDLRLAGYVQLADRLGVRIAGSAEAGYDESIFYETALLGQLVWGDLEFGKTGPGVGRRSFASKLVASGMRKIISVVPLLNNNVAGTSGHCWGLALGSIDNTLRFENSALRLSEAIPEVLAHERLDLRERVVLAITDAMLCQYQGEERQLLHYSTVLDQLWLSVDPVALDVLAVQEIDRQRRLAEMDSPKTSMELYENLALLELGVSDPQRIEIRRVELSLDAPPRGL